MERDSAIRSADIDLGFMDLNTASEQDLAKIPGIGPDLAHTLCEHRPFATIEELTRVPGIEQDQIDELLRAGVTVGAPPAPVQ